MSPIERNRDASNNTLAPFQRAAATTKTNKTRIRKSISDAVTHRGPIFLNKIVVFFDIP